MRCTRRTFLRGFGGLATALMLSPLSIVKAFAGNGNKEEEKYSKLRKELYQELDSLMKRSGSCDAYSEQKHFASRIIKLFSDEKECKFAKKALEHNIDASTEDGAKDQDLEDIPIIDSSVRINFAKEYIKIAEEYSKELLKLAKTCDRKKAGVLRKKTIDTIFALNPNDKNTRKYLKDEYVSGYGWVNSNTAKKLRTQRVHNGRWVTKKQAGTAHENWETPWVLGSKHFVIRSNASEKQAVALLKAAEEYYDFFTQEFGRYFQIKDTPKRIEIDHMPVSEYKKACKDRLIFEDMRGFADKKKVYLRQVDKKNDKDCLKSWKPLRSQEDVMREALFNLFCYKRIVRGKEDTPEAIHTDNYDRAEEFALVRGLSIFFSSKPKVSFPPKPSHTDTCRIYEVPKTDKTLHANFLRLYSNKTPSLDPLKDRTASPEHDTAMWGRLNCDYFKPGKYQHVNRRKLFLFSKWAFEDALDEGFQEDHFSKKNAKETVEYIKKKKK